MHKKSTEHTMRTYDHIGNKRRKEHGLLVAIKKDVIDYLKKGISKEDWALKREELKEKFAHSIGLASWGSFENKLKRSKDDTDITVTELIHIAEITGSFNPLKYLNEMFGFVMTSTECGEECSMDQLHMLTDEAQIEGSESFTITKKALRDGKITVDEKEAMLKESMEAVEALTKQIDAIRKIKPIDGVEDDED